MIWAGIIGNEIVGPFLIPDRLKMNSANYCTFLDENFMPWLNSQDFGIKESIIFQQDNAPSHASRFTKSWLASVGITGERLMDWPSQSPDLNLIENLWSIIKRKVYEKERQFANKKDLWERIKEICFQISSEVVKKLTSSVDGRMVKLIQSGGKRIKY